MTQPLTVGDLFSGIGGFSLAARWMNWRTIWFSEIDPYCQQVLAQHWPGVPQLGDITQIDWSTVERPDVLCGGFPCQDISNAGKRAGIGGARSGLWSEYARAIRDLRPRYVVVENSAALLGRGLGRVLGDLAALGYDAEWHCIPASAVGADHLRDRIWIIAHPNGTGDQSLDFIGREPRQSEVGEDAAHHHSARPSRRVQAGAHCEDAGDFRPWLRSALDTAPAFPGLDGAGAPVLGRGENGIPHRVDRMHAIGNAVVPQIPHVIFRCIEAREALT
jgi:DNA (cytosine-5)-methyltransferase 1